MFCIPGILYLLITLFTEASHHHRALMAAVAFRLIKNHAGGRLKTSSVTFHSAMYKFSAIFFYPAKAALAVKKRGQAVENLNFRVTGQSASSGCSP